MMEWGKCTQNERKQETRKPCEGVGKAYNGAALGNIKERAEDFCILPHVTAAV